MFPPIGWQNLSSTKQKTSDRSTVRAAVQEVHPNAEESEIAPGLLAYWLMETPARLVALAWEDDRGGRWNYTIMSKVALNIGMQCSVYPISEHRYRVLPCRADQTETIHRQLQAARARLKRLKGRETKINLDTFLYEGEDGWHVSIETPQGVVVNDYGPYATYDAANLAFPSLIQQVEASISLSG